jgi:hypothetical protein
MHTAGERKVRVDKQDDSGKLSAAQTLHGRKDSPG